jgi:hypothetical protein
MWRAIFSSLWIGLLMAPVAADAAIYGWRDLQGVSHYVSDPEDVPPEYRTQLTTVVKDLPLAPLLASSPDSSPAATEDAAVPRRVSEPPMETSYEWGYRAGLDAAPASRDPSVTSIVNLQVVESPQPAYYYPPSYYPFGFFGPVLGGGHVHPRRPLKSPMGAPFIQGPAGPPPLGAPGPPPVSFIRR